MNNDEITFSSPVASKFHRLKLCHWAIFLCWFTENVNLRERESRSDVMEPVMTIDGIEVWLDLIGETEFKETGEPVFFDIETAPLPDSVLMPLLPDLPESKRPKHPGELEVKYGNTVDEAKRAKKLAESLAKHKTALESYELQLEAAQIQWEQSFFVKAALSPFTGSVCAIGYKQGHQIFIQGGQETLMLSTAGRLMRSAVSIPCGWNVRNFDLPFLVRRSSLNEHANLIDLRESRSHVTDAMELFMGGRYEWYHPLKQQNVRMVSLSDAAKLCRCSRPENVDVKGKDFHALFSISETRDKAIEYLAWDLIECERICEALNLI